MSAEWIVAILGAGGLAGVATAGLSIARWVHTSFGPDAARRNMVAWRDALGVDTAERRITSLEEGQRERDALAVVHSAWDAQAQASDRAHRARQESAGIDLSMAPPLPPPPPLIPQPMGRVDTS